MARPALDEQQLAAMRQRLADQALAIYRERGLAAVSFRRVADAVGISHTLIYRYFPDKDALLAQARAACFRDFETFVRAREAEDSGMTAHLHSVAQAYVDFAQQCPADYRLMFSTEQPPPDRYPELLAARQSLFEHAVDLVEHYVQRGELFGDARLIAHALWINLHGLMMLHGARQLVHGMTLAQLIDPIIDRLLTSEEREP